MRTIADHIPRDQVPVVAGAAGYDTAGLDRMLATADLIGGHADYYMSVTAHDDGTYTLAVR